MPLASVDHATGPARGYRKLFVGSPAMYQDAGAALDKNSAEG